MKELAIFRHFYHLSRESALLLPKWEWEDLISQFYAFKSEERIHQVYAASFGFNGGESSQTYLKNLESIINAVNSVNVSEKHHQDWKTATGKDFQNLDSYGDEETLENIDKFFTSFGI